MKRVGVVSFLTILLAASGFTQDTDAAPFQNGSFENVTGSCFVELGVGQPVGAGWVVSRGSVDLYNNAVPGCGWQAADGFGSVDLVGGGSSGGVAQTFDTIPGAIYRVSFAIAGNPSPSFPRPQSRTRSTSTARC